MKAVCHTGNGTPAEANSHKVMGVHWVPMSDHLRYTVKLIFSAKRRGVRSHPDLTEMGISEGMTAKLTKRLILSCVNGSYDPLGLHAPFIIRAKIMLRALGSLHSKTLDWDDPVPSDMQNDWYKFFRDRFQVNDLFFKRCIKSL